MNMILDGFLPNLPYTKYAPGTPPDIKIDKNLHLWKTVICFYITWLEKSNQVNCMAIGYNWTIYNQINSNQSKRSEFDYHL